MIFLSISEKNFIDNKKSLYYNTKSMNKGVHPFEESIPRRAERLFILPCTGNQIMSECVVIMLRVHHKACTEWRKL